MGIDANLASIDGLLALGNLSEAQDHLQRLADAGNARTLPVAYHLLRGRLAMRQEDWTEALDAWQAAIACNPGNREARLKAGKCLQMLEQHDASVAHIKEALRLGAPDYDCFLLLARAYGKVGKNHLALRCWRRLIDGGHVRPEIIEGAVTCAHSVKDHSSVVELAVLACQKRIALPRCEIAIAESALLCGNDSANRLLTGCEGMFTRDLMQWLDVIGAVASGDIEKAEAAMQTIGTLPKSIADMLSREILRLRIAAEHDTGAGIRATCAGLVRNRLPIGTAASLLIEILQRLPAGPEILREPMALIVDQVRSLAQLEVIVQIMRRRGDLRLAEGLARSAIAAHANHSAFQAELAACLRADGRLDAAIEIYVELAFLVPAVPGALEAAVDCMLAARRIGEMAKLVQEIVERGLADDLPLLLARARIAAARRDHAEAARLASAALELDPKSVAIRIRLATALMARLDFAPAFGVLREALDVQPDNAEVLLHAAACCRALGLIEEMKACYLTLARIHPANARLLVAMGEVFHAVGEGFYDEMVDAVEDADVPAEETRLALASLAYEMGHVDRAADLAQPLSSGSGVARQRAVAVLAKCLVSERRSEEALALLETCLDEEPLTSEIVKDYMNALMGAGLYEKAQEFPTRFPALFDTEYVQYMTVHARVNARIGRPGSDGWWLEYRSAPHAKYLRSGLSGLNYDPDVLSFREAASSVVLPILGVGDEIRFASIYREVIADRRSTTFVCDPRLQSLLSRSFPDAQFIASRRRGSEAHTPAGIATTFGLPDQELSRVLDFAGYENVRTFENVILISDLLEHYRPNAASYADRSPYLTPDPSRAAEAARLTATRSQGPKIGITWRSGLIRTSRLANYTSLDEWGDIFATPNATFYSFQHDDAEAEIAEAERLFGVEIRRFPTVDLKDDFETVAALLTGLDMMVGPSVAVTELAGALGLPVLMLWRVPNGRYRMHVGDGRDLWHRSMTPIFGDPIEDGRSMLGRAAAHLAEITRFRTNWTAPIVAEN